MSDQPLNTVTKDSSETSSEQTTDNSSKTSRVPKPDKESGWELRLFIRALLAQNLSNLLELTEHTQHELMLYTGLSKQTIVDACYFSEKDELSSKEESSSKEKEKKKKEKKALSELNTTAFNSNTFVLSLCYYLDTVISNLNNNGFERERIVLKLLDRNSDNYAALSTFLQSEGLSLEQIDTYTMMLAPSLQQSDSLSSHARCSTFLDLWSQSFMPSFETYISRELKGLRFKDALLGTCGVDSFAFTKARNVYFDLVFLRQADLGSDIFMRPLLHCLKQNKVRCLFDFEQLDRLNSLVNYDWKQALFNIITCRNYLSDPNITEYKDKVFLANQQLQFILLFSRLLRNLAILRELELVPYRDKDKERPIDLLLSQKFAAKDYLEQAKQLIKGIISGLNSLTKRREINLDSALSFLQSLDETGDNQYYVFTAGVSNDTIIDHNHWPFNGIYPDPHYKLDLRNDNGCTLFCKAKESGLVQHKDLHVLKYQTFCTLPFNSVVSSRLDLVKPYDKSQPIKLDLPVGSNGLIPLPLFHGNLDTYYQSTADGFEVDKTRGGATHLAQLHLDKALQSVLDQLPDAYYGTVLSDQNTPQDIVAALDKVLARGGFEG